MLDAVKSRFISNELLTEIRSEKTTPQPGIVGKTGQLIGTIGSGVWSGAAGAVSLGVSAVSTGFSAGSSIVSGVISYLPFPRRVGSADAPSQPQDDISEQKPTMPPAAKSGIISAVLFRGTTKAKADWNWHFPLLSLIIWNQMSSNFMGSAFFS